MHRLHSGLLIEAGRLLPEDYAEAFVRSHKFMALDLSRLTLISGLYGLSLLLTHQSQADHNSYIPQALSL